jgi:hypothetical protein
LLYLSKLQKSTSGEECDIKMTNGIAYIAVVALGVPQHIGEAQRKQTTTRWYNGFEYEVKKTI